MRIRSSILLKALVALTAAAGAVSLGGYLWWAEYFRPVSFEAVAPDNALLIEGVESYLSVDAFLLKLKARSLAYEVERSPTPEKSKRPPFNVTTVKVDAFSALGCTGQLTVEFFNDRLVGVRFFPSDMDEYRKRLLSQRGLDLLTQSEASASSNARVWSASDQAGRSYVGWEDVRLAKEMELWIKRYS